MSTDNGHDDSVRNEFGQFVDGNPGSAGKPPGTLNSTTVDIRRIRRSLIDAWDDVNATLKLIKLANGSDEGFVTFCKIVAMLLPKNEREASGPTQIMVFNAAIHDAAAVKVAEVLQADGNTGPVTPALCIEKLRVITQERLHDNGNGRDIPRHRDEEVRGSASGDAGPGQGVS